MKFTSTNLNPSGKRKGDCVVRAIMAVTGNTWSEVFDSLYTIAKAKYAMPNSKEVYETYLEQQGLKKQKMPRFADNTRYTVREFADSFPEGKYVVSVANHMTAVINGNLVDTWDCSRKSVGNYWK